MSITIFGFIWIAVLIFSFFNNNPKYMISTILLAMVFQSASVIMLGDDGIGPQVITSGVAVLYTVIFSMRTGSFGKIHLSKIKAPNISMAASLVLIISMVISYLINRKNYSISQNQFILWLLMIIIYIFCYFSCWILAKTIEKKELEKIIIRAITFVVVIGALQFLTTINILPRNFLWTTFIYTSDTRSAYYWDHSAYKRLFSTFMEPSYCGAFLVGAFYYVISRKLTRQKILLSIALAIEIILTFSSTAYGTLAIVGVIYLFVSKDKKALKYLVPIALLACFLALFSGGLMDVLNQVIFEKDSTGSFHTRQNWDINALEQFKLFPKFGAGYKNVRGAQFLPSLLAQIGIFGAIPWFFMSFSLLFSSLKKSNQNNISCGLFLISTIVAMFIGIPDIDFSCFWNAMHIFALTYSVNAKKII